ncbi:MAG TPA: hypothetical protein VG816_02985 [Solirubrobacterales bacterium]|nr:hypothetical protein [Solirubrobacterales bacterium]
MSQAAESPGTQLGFPAGPVADRLSVWPMEDGRYGLDATFQGATGYERAESHRELLEASGIQFSFRQELGGAWTLRFGPLDPPHVSAALSSFVR